MSEVKLVAVNTAFVLASTTFIGCMGWLVVLTGGWFCCTTPGTWLDPWTVTPVMIFTPLAASGGLAVLLAWIRLAWIRR